MSTLATLGEELVGQVLRWLSSEDVEAARQACRLFDAASRTQLESASAVTLGPRNTVDGARGPDWSHFPRLRTVNIHSWHDASDLLSCFAVSSRRDQALANLAQVTTLGIESSDEPALALTATLSGLPSVTTLRINGNNYRGRPVLEQMAAVAAMAALAPQLVDLTIDFRLNQQQATCLTAHLPYLRSLRLVGMGCLGVVGGDDERAAVWAALPCSRLTSLQAADVTSYSRLPSDFGSLLLPWLQMRELRGVELPFDFVEQLAAGLPNLQLLKATATGRWGPTRAVIPHLKQLTLEGCENGLSDTRLAELSQRWSAVFLTPIWRLSWRRCCWDAVLMLEE